VRVGPAGKGRFLPGDCPAASGRGVGLANDNRGAAWAAAPGLGSESADESAMAAYRLRGCHDGNCESAVRLDLIHRAACPWIDRSAFGDPSRVHPVHPCPELAGAGPRIRHGSARCADRSRPGRDPRRIELGGLRPGKFAGGALPVLCLGWSRRCGGLRRMHRAGLEVVSGSSRIGGGSCGRCLRFGCRADRGPDPPPDRGCRISDRLHDLGAPAGRGDRDCRLAHDGPHPGWRAPDQRRRLADTLPRVRNAGRVPLPSK